MTNLLKIVNDKKPLPRCEFRSSDLYNIQIQGATITLMTTILDDNMIYYMISLSHYGI